jgi:hypothetical protein
MTKRSVDMTKGDIAIEIEIKESELPQSADLYFNYLSL